MIEINDENKVVILMDLGVQTDPQMKLKVVQNSTQKRLVDDSGGKVDRKGVRNALGGSFSSTWADFWPMGSGFSRTCFLGSNLGSGT